MSAAVSRQNSRKPPGPGEAAREREDKKNGKTDAQEKTGDSRAASPAETPRENKPKTNASPSPAEKLSPRTPRRGSSSITDAPKRKPTYLGSELKGPPPAPLSAYDQRLQFALKRLSLWDAEPGKEEARGRNHFRAPANGSSPPEFVVSLTANWPDCQALCSFMVADLGSKVALWTVETPTTPASFLVYDPRRRRLEEEKGSGEQPQAALGVSLTPARIRDIRGVFVFGGRSHEGEIVDDCFFYNAASRKWSKVKCQGEKPPKRCFHAAAFSAKTQSLYVFGGQGEDGKALAGTWKLAGGKEWKLLGNQDDPPPRTHHTLSLVEGATTGENLVQFGGLVDGADTNDLWILPLGSKKPTWHCIGDASGTPPAKRHGHSATVAGPRCFIFGGLGKHWLGWEVSYFDMNAFDIEVSSWFSVNLLSPFANLPSHSLAVATGDPSTMLHVFASGEKSWKDGAIYRLAAVCSTLDMSTFAQGLRLAKVVSADNRKRQEELRLAVDELVSSAKEKESVVHSHTNQTNELEGEWESLLRRISDTHSDLLKKVIEAQELEAKTATIVSEAATREAEASQRCDELQRQLEYFQLRLDEVEQLSGAASSRQQSSDADAQEDQ